MVIIIYQFSAHHYKGIIFIIIFDIQHKTVPWNILVISFFEVKQIFAKNYPFLYILLDKKVSNDTLLNVLFFTNGKINNIGYQCQKVRKPFMLA